MLRGVDFTPGMVADLPPVSSRFPSLAPQHQNEFLFGLTERNRQFASYSIQEQTDRVQVEINRILGRQDLNHGTSFANINRAPRLDRGRGVTIQQFLGGLPSARRDQSQMEILGVIPGTISGSSQAPPSQIGKSDYVPSSTDYHWGPMGPAGVKDPIPSDYQPTINVRGRPQSNRSNPRGRGRGRGIAPDNSSDTDRSGRASRGRGRGQSMPGRSAPAPEPVRNRARSTSTDRNRRKFASTAPTDYFDVQAAPGQATPRDHTRKLYG